MKATKKPDTIKKKRAKNGAYYFVRIAPNGEQVFKSQMYPYHGSRWKAIARIKAKENVIEK